MDRLTIEARLKLKLKGVKQKRCRVWFEEDKEIPLRTRLCWAEEEGNVAVTAGSLFELQNKEEGYSIEEVTFNLKYFYEQYGPLFKEKRLTIFEILDRIKNLFGSIFIFNAMLPAEGSAGMEKKRTYASFRYGIQNMAEKLSRYGYEEWRFNPFTEIDNILNGREEGIMPFLSDSGYPAFKFPCPPEEFETKEAMFQWARPFVYEFLSKLLGMNCSYSFFVNKKGRPVLTAEVNEIPTLVLASIILNEEGERLKECSILECSTLVREGKEYCPKHERTYGEGYAKGKALDIFRKRKNRGKISDLEYEELKKRFNWLKQKGLKGKDKYVEKGEKFLLNLKKNPGR